jgi:hypothetical protein
VLVIAWCVVAVVSPFLALRWPAGLFSYRWRWPLLVWAALALQVVAVEVSMPEGLAATLHVATYAVALGFLWVNRRAAGVWIVAAGALSNGVTIALNGGVLPANARAVASAGIDADSAFANSAVLPHPVLPWLGDVFAWPAPLPLANVFSVGDILIVIGAFIAAWRGARRFGDPRSSPGERDDLEPDGAGPRRPTEPPPG